MLQAERSLVQILMRSLDFFNISNPSSLTVALEMNQPLTEMSATNVPWGSKALRVKHYSHVILHLIAEPMFCVPCLAVFHLSECLGCLFLTDGEMKHLLVVLQLLETL
jgi:hypothetical protein